MVRRAEGGQIRGKASSFSPILIRGRELEKEERGGREENERRREEKMGNTYRRSVSGSKDSRELF